MFFDMERIIRDIPKRMYLSERDFQLSLAMQIEADYGRNSVICEFPTVTKSGKGEKQIHIDILYLKENIPIEIKYRTIKATGNVVIGENSSEKIILKNHGARDEGCMGFWLDVCRLYEYKKKNHSQSGYLVFLTNDVWYTKPYFGKCRTRDYSSFALNSRDNLLEWKKMESNTRQLKINKVPVGNPLECPYIEGKWTSWELDGINYWCDIVKV